MKTSELDQKKRGLQDDHDPGDLGQQQANRRRGVEPKVESKVESKPEPKPEPKPPRGSARKSDPNNLKPEE